jgi:hypothetical protein
VSRPSGGGLAESADLVVIKLSGFSFKARRYVEVDERRRRRQYRLFDVHLRHAGDKPLGIEKCAAEAVAQLADMKHDASPRG